ncbi:von Willebrand factor A domain-containing protein 5A-like, partial [Rhincodon typus]|uniref:von Willebrand factor A domain-containing protein 5A-like n=1 Tax=Rhincodon typus TaxID=259920 RepID=UPI00202E192A
MAALTLEGYGTVLPSRPFAGHRHGFGTDPGSGLQRSIVRNKTPGHVRYTNSVCVDLSPIREERLHVLIESEPTQDVQPVPLKSISVEIEVKGFVADVSASLEYKNEETEPVEAVFVFPMDSDAAVYNFQAMVDGKTIVAVIKEKEKAKDDYDDAISSGHQAFLLEEDSSSSDIFSCTVGNLPPGQSATVSFSFVQELAIEADGAVRFVLPAILNPRYTPTDAQSPSVTQDVPQVQQAPYTLVLKAQIQSAHTISHVQSNCGLTALEYLSENKTAAK